MTNIVRLALLTSTVAMGFDWKMDGDKLATDGDGNPVWINGDKELTVKGDTVVALQGEAKRNRQRAEVAEQSLAKFDGITDPDAARQALETVGRLDAKQLIDAGKVDEVKAEITKQYETKIQTAEQAAADANRRADTMLLDNAFATSEFANNRLTDAGRDLARSMFGSRFKVDNGNIVAQDANGNTLYSDKNMGDAASFDEALEKTINTYKHKDTILKAPEAGGGTGGNGGGGQRGQSRTISRADFGKMKPHEQQDVAAKARTGEVSIVD